MKSSLLASMLALTLASPAIGAEQNLSPGQVEGAVRYALPSLLEAVQGACTGQLARDGYLARNGDHLAVRFADGHEAYWPQAKAALILLGGKGKESSGLEEFANLPDEALRPFVDGIIVAKLSEEIKPNSCADIERVLELLDPLPVDNLTGLVGTIVAMVETRRSQSAPANASAATND
jgi:hypothetical protein